MFSKVYLQAGAVYSFRMLGNDKDPADPDPDQQYCFQQL